MEILLKLIEYNIMEYFIKKIINKKEILKSKYPIQQIALFGSSIRDDFEIGRSDIDIMVDFTEEDAMQYIALAEELEEILGQKVDLVSKRALKPRQLEYLEKEFVYV